MGGALLQLASRGEQNKFLDFKPEFSFFKTAYKRHSGFARQTYELSLNSSKFGEKSVCSLLTDPDLITGIKLQIHLPSLNVENLIKYAPVCSKDVDITCFCKDCNTIKSDTVFGWANSIGHLMIEEYSFSVGTKEIDKRTGEWLEWWSDLAQTAEKKAGYWTMIGKREPATFKPTVFSDSLDLIIPLDFYFTGNPCLAFPICALNEHDITVNIKWRNFNELWTCTDENAKPGFVPPFRATLLVDYVFLDNAEHNKFKRDNHLYLIEQVQQGCPSYFNQSTHEAVVDINFQQPVKSIYWAIRRDGVETRSKKGDIDFSYGNDWFNYSCYKSRFKNVIKDPVDRAHITLDGEDRTGKHSGIYYRLSETYDYHTKTPSNYIYCYCFSMFPEEHQPSGTCNFSMFNKPKLRIKLCKNYPSNYNVISYAYSYNWLIIKSNKISLAYSV